MFSTDEIFIFYNTINENNQKYLLDKVELELESELKTLKSKLEEEIIKNSNLEKVLKSKIDEINKNNNITEIFNSKLEILISKLEKEISRNGSLEETLKKEIERNISIEDKISKIETEYSQISKLWNIELYTKYL
jgi:hypothetical protein